MVRPGSPTIQVQSGYTRLSLKTTVTRAFQRKPGLRDLAKVNEGHVNSEITVAIEN